MFFVFFRPDLVQKELDPTSIFVYENTEPLGVTVANTTIRARVAWLTSRDASRGTPEPVVEFLACSFATLEVDLAQLEGGDTVRSSLAATFVAEPGTALFVGVAVR